MDKDRAAPRPGFAGPLYTQVAQHLRQRIENLEWRSDIAMPNEALLARQMGVSIGTMRKALQELEDDKVIVRQQGRGTFVIDSRIETELARFETLFAADLHAAAIGRVISCGDRLATASEARRLRLGAGQLVVELVRTRRSNGQFSSCERIVLPHSVFAGIEEVHGLGDALLFPVYRRDFHVVVDHVEETIAPVNSGPELSAALGLGPGQAVLGISRIATAGNGAVLEWSLRFVHLEYVGAQMTDLLHDLTLPPAGSERLARAI